MRCLLAGALAEMRVAYLGYDFFLSALKAALSNGHELCAIFTFETDDNFNFNVETRRLATDLGVPATTKRFTPEDACALVGQVDALLVMGYPHKVPIIEQLRAVNLHPTLLPEGRGPFPIPWLILRNPAAAGLTFHKVTAEWDSGDILNQVSVPIHPSETLLSLCAKMQMRAQPFVSETLENFDRLWAAAAPPVGRGSYWRASPGDWTLDWSAGVAAILLQVRAFGQLEAVAWLYGEEWLITDADGWLEAHDHQPGIVVHDFGLGKVVATTDGYVLLKRPRKEGTSADEN